MLISLTTFSDVPLVNKLGPVLSKTTFEPFVLLLDKTKPLIILLDVGTHNQSAQGETLHIMCQI